MSSRERMLAALNCRKPDYVPCNVGMPPPQGREFQDQFEAMDWQLEQGMDVVCYMPAPPIRFAPEVSIREWKDRPAGAPYHVIHREYRTPTGSLMAAAYLAPSWRYGEQMPLYSDHLSSHSVKYLITQPSDLAGFTYLLAPLTDEDITAYREMAARYRQYTKSQDVLFAADWGGQHEDEAGGHFVGRLIKQVNLMMANWILFENLKPFCEVCAWISGYIFDDFDWDAISHGIKTSDNKSGLWFSYEFAGANTISFRLSFEPEGGLKGIVFVVLS